MALAAVDVLKGTAEALAQVTLALQGEAANAAPPAAVSVDQKCEAMGRIVSGCYEKEGPRVLQDVALRRGDPDGGKHEAARSGVAHEAVVEGPR